MKMNLTVKDYWCLDDDQNVELVADTSMSGQCILVFHGMDLEFAVRFLNSVREGSAILALAGNEPSNE